MPHFGSCEPILQELHKKTWKLFLEIDCKFGHLPKSYILATTVTIRRKIKTIERATKPEKKKRKEKKRKGKRKERREEIKAGPNLPAYAKNCEKMSLLLL